MVKKFLWQAGRQAGRCGRLEGEGGPSGWCFIVFPQMDGLQQ